MSDESSTSFEDFLSSGDESESATEQPSTASADASSTPDSADTVRQQQEDVSAEGPHPDNDPFQEFIDDNTREQTAVSSAGEESSENQVNARKRVETLLSSGPSGSTSSAETLSAEGVEESTEGEGSSATNNTSPEQPHVDEKHKTLLSKLASSTGVGAIVFKIERLIESIVGRVMGVPAEKTLSEYYYPSDVIRDDEEVIWASVPSRWQALGPYLLSLFFAVSAIGFWIASATGAVESYLNARSPTFFAVELSPLVTIAIVMILSFFAILTALGQIFHRASTWYIVTDSRIVYRRNPINRKRKRINLDDINKADDRYPVPQRFVGIGSIDIYTASTDNRELRMRALHEPGARADEIDDVRAERSGDTTRDDDGTADNENESSGLFSFS